jgi:hypothetical protein
MASGEIPGGVPWRFLERLGKNILGRVVVLWRAVGDVF